MGLKGKSWGGGSVIQFTIDEWNADEVLREFKEAEKSALKRAADEGIRAAQSTTPVLTGDLKRSLNKSEPKEEKSDIVSILWGSFIIRYARYVELGTYKMSPRRYLKRAMDKSYGVRNRLGHILKEEWAKRAGKI